MAVLEKMLVFRNCRVPPKTPKSGNEPAIIQVVNGTLESLNVNTVGQAMEHPAPYDSKANGAVENAVKQVQGLARTLGIALERAISKSVPL